MFLGKKMRKISLILALSLVLTGISFPGNATVVNATETAEETSVATMSPEPTASPNPYWLYYPIKETFDSYNLETCFTDLTTGQGYQLLGNHEEAIVVSKQEVDQTAEFTDYCLKVPYNHSASGDTKSLRFNIFSNLEYKYRLGDAAVDTNSIVVEMDVAIKGEGVKENGYRICFSQRYNGSTASVAGYILNDTQLRHHNDSQASYHAANAEKGSFATLKLVIDKKTSTYKYYWDGKLMAHNQTALHTGTPDVGCILIQCLPEASEVDSALYIDNVKLYLYSEEPELSPDFGPTPTPMPTECPAPTPMPGISDQLEINNTSSATAPATITAPTGGWVEGDNIFTVACEKPCFVAVSYDGGETFTRLVATSVTNGYRYTAEDMTVNTILAIGYVGDINGDGAISNSDATRLAAIYAGKTSASNALMGLLCDVNHDGQVTNSDITGLCAAYAGKKQLNW